VLSPDQSAVLRDRLLVEIADLPSEDSATNWAQRALAAKNQLTAADARLVKSQRTPTPFFASKNDPSDGAETGAAEPHIAEQSRSWRASSSEREVMRGS
jgi:hypothetical protein